MDLNRYYAIGNGAGFPIKLTTVMRDGKPEMVTLPDGTMVPKVTWAVSKGDVDLIRQNITAILVYEIGTRIRQEYFGCRIWEAIEEPNTSFLQAQITRFISDSLSTWEPRVDSMSVEVIRSSKESLGLHLNFSIRGIDGSNDVYFGIDY